MKSISEISEQIIEQVKLLTQDNCLAKNISIDINTGNKKGQFGDLSTNAALIVSKIIKESPVAVAQKIIYGLTNRYIEKVEIAGPGFINIFLSIEACQDLALEIYNEKEEFFKLDIDAEKIAYSDEFVSANPTGPLHIGHGRGGIIGDVLGNVLRFLGHQVTKEFYVNDAGSQIQKLGISFKIRCLQQLGQSIELPEGSYHGEYLTELAKEVISDQGQEIANKPDDWFSQYAKDKLLKRIQDTLKLYGITYDVWFSELKLHKDGSIIKALEVLKDRNYLYEKEGALWFKSTEFGDDKDRVVKKNTGELTYVAADVAYIINKIERGAKKLIYVLGQDHHSYVVRLKSVAQALGYSPDMIDVILYQLVTLKEEGQALRMSKRAGRIVTLKDLIETIGTDCARFFYLNKKADAHLDFDVELALKKSDENPVFYIQYAYVRTNSILKKAQEISDLSNISDLDVKFIGEEEKVLIKKIVSLKELLLSISKNYQVHLVTYYVIELAQLFHSYYNANKVINSNDITKSRGRLLMMKLLNSTFKVSFDLLGISKPENM